MSIDFAVISGGLFCIVLVYVLRIARCRKVKGVDLSMRRRQTQVSINIDVARFLHINSRSTQTFACIAWYSRPIYSP